MSKTMQSRLPVPDVAALDESQKVVYDSILSTRGNIDGPFLAWMHSPELASRAEKLGAFCRYQTSLKLIESELLIFVLPIITIAWENNKSMNQSPVLQDLGWISSIRFAKEACPI